MLAQLPVVHSTDGLTPDWLAAALDAPVTGFSTVAIGDGHMSDSYRIALDYAASGVGPDTVVGKFASTDPTSRASGTELGIYEREVRFYREIAPHLGPDAPAPKCYVSVQEPGMNRPGHRAPEGYDASAFPTFAVTVDIVILTIREGRLHVLLVQRGGEPYAGAWALPGGFKRPDETLDDAARRELREETGVIAPKHLAQFGAYGDPGRDPRTNVVTVAYLAVTPELGSLRAGTDAAAARLWPVADAVRDLPLAFDHHRILSDAIERAAEQLEQTDLATAFVGETFALSELQSVYEELWQSEIDPANFRRSLTTPAPAAATPDSYVEPTGQRAKASPRGGRPPELFRAGGAWLTQPPVLRPRRPKERPDDN